MNTTSNANNETKQAEPGVDYCIGERHGCGCEKCWLASFDDLGHSYNNGEYYEIG